MALLPSQLEKPIAQRKPHLELAHVAAALGGTGHAEPHTPQFNGLALMSTSQPLAMLLSQSAKPVAHCARHIPAMHTGTVPGIVEAHTLPQAPQLAKEVRVSTSQPLALFMSQSTKPAMQLEPQAPAVHVGVALLGATQRSPQRPQLDTSLVSAVSQPLALFMSQLPKPIAHRSEHAPITHCSVLLAPPTQRVLQAPQLFVSARRSCSQPLTLFMSQLPKPMLQTSPQAPDEHCGVALAPAGHEVPHVPQVDALRWMSASQPLSGMRSQSAKPELHMSPQVPMTQRAVELTAAGHELPQRPQ